MAAIDVLEAEVDGPFSNDDATYEKPTGAGITSGFVGSAKYLVLVFAQIGTDDAGNQHNEVHMVHGSTEFPESLWEGELNADISYNYFWWTVFTQTATPEDIDFQFNSGDVGAGTALNMRNFRMYAIRIDDDLTENTDWFFDESTTTVANTTTWSNTNRASQAWTPAAADDDWLVLWRGRIVHNAGTPEAGVRLQYGVTSSEAVVTGNNWREREDPDDDRTTYGGFYVAKAVSAAGHTALIETADDAVDTQTDHSHSGVFILNLAKFEDHSDVHTAGSTAQSATFAEVATVTHDPATTGDSLVLASSDNEFAAGTHHQWKRIQFAGTSDPTDVENRISDDANDAADDFGSTVMVMHSFSASTAIDLDARASNTSNNVHHRQIVAISMELATAGVIELTGTIEAAAESSATATQTHEGTATLEAAAESVGTATQVHQQAATLEAAAEATAAATLVHRIVGTVEAAAESVGTVTQTHKATATIEAAAEATGVAVQTHQQAATLEAAVEVVGSVSTSAITELTGTVEAAVEASGVAVQVHETASMLEAAAESTATGSQIHQQAATLEAAVEVAGTVSVSGAVELVAALEVAVEVSGAPTVGGVVELTGTLEVAAESTGIATQTHTASATLEAATESTAVATQIHVAAGVLEAAAETTAAASIIFELTGAAEAAAEVVGSVTQTHNATAILEAAAESTGAATQTHNATAITEAAAEVAGVLTATTATTKGFVAVTIVLTGGLVTAPRVKVGA